MKVFLVVGFVVILGISGFYWSQIRPAHIKTECNEWAIQEEKQQINLAYEQALKGNLPLDLKDYETLYNQCLREKGL